jgi:ABC-type uncharacterized transport system ATPase subunit
MAHRGGTAGIATNGPEQLTTILKGYHMVSDGEIMTEPELKVLVLQQLSDLKERGMEEAVRYLQHVPKESRQDDERNGGRQRGHNGH